MNNKIKIIPIFVPHVGCPNDCVFCNQKKITGKGNVIVNRQYVIDIVEEFKKTIGKNTFTELAFFGGSFTAIDLQLQEELLEIGKYYKDNSVVQRIRISTRPDAISDEILELQKKYGVDIIELGIQSLDEEVLIKSNRGHTIKDSENASALIKKHGFILGHQIMLGLAGSTKEKEIKTCMDSIKMKPEIVRIYPTLIIKDTELLNMYKAGVYSPLRLEEAVDIAAIIYSHYMMNNINVIRIGLQNTESINLENDVVKGPFHPAFRQLVEEKLFFKFIYNSLINKSIEGGAIKIFASGRNIDYIVGQKRANTIKFKRALNIKKIFFEKTDDENTIEIWDDEKIIDKLQKTNIYRNYLSDITL